MLVDLGLYSDVLLYILVCLFVHVDDYMCLSEAVQFL